MAGYQIIENGPSRSFPEPHALHDGAGADGDVVVITGANAGAGLAPDPAKAAILVELDRDCLAVHIGEDDRAETANILGFARVRIGDDPPSDAVELVCRPHTSQDAIEAARAVLAGAGLTVAVCGDFAGRIVDRLVRPYYNEALRQLDDGLASADDLDLTVKLGLGYSEGPIGLLERSGLAHHHDVTKALFETYGTPAFAPPRRAVVAKTRQCKT